MVELGSIISATFVMQDLPFNPLRHPAIFTQPERSTRVRECYEHIPFAAFAISVLRPKLLVELGTADGDFYSAMCQIVKEQGLETDCYAVVDETIGVAQADLRDHHQSNFGAFSHFILSEEAVAHFPDGAIDLLHINFPWAARDCQRLLETWAPKLSRQGVVMIPGWQMANQAKERNNFQARIAPARAHFEFIHGGGFQALAIGEAVSEEFLEFLTAAVEEPEKTRDFFAQLGRALAERCEARRQLGALSGENDELKAKLAQTERTLKLVNERLEARTRELEAFMGSLSYTAKTRILAVYMRLPYRLRLVITEGVRRLLNRSRSAPPLEPPPPPTLRPAPAKPVNKAECEEIISALIAEFASRRKAVDAGAARVDVIVPVYRGVEETLRCLAAARRSRGSAAFELIAINDASPEPLLVEYLERLAANGLLTLLHNAENLGFVKTVNRGMALHPERDVVLLNSDTQVCGDWLDRLRRAAYGAGDIGTVTPFSNNATICSYPEFPGGNPLPPDASIEQLDRLCAEMNAGERVEIPTAVGFCMYIRRACLNEVGYFDEQRFGRGYGEENDFCMRARARGWRSVLTGDTFVYHAGSVSFGGGNGPAIRRAMEVIAGLHPNYHSLVERHIAADPAKPLRRRLDVGRLAGTEPAMLLVNHNWGGGVTRHVLDLAARLRAEGFRPIILQPLEGDRVRLHSPGIETMPNLVFHARDEYQEMVESLRSLGIVHAHIHHTINLPERALDPIKELGLTYDWTVHDYYVICPRVNLLNGRSRYCGEPEPEACNRCIKQNGVVPGAFSAGEVEIGRWRATHAAWLAGARKVFVPHEEVGARLARYFPQTRIEERRHFETYPPASGKSTYLISSAKLKVAVIGAIGKHKGSDVLYACALDAAERKLPLSFHVVGYTDNDKRFASLPNARITGEYAEAEVFNVLEAEGCHCALFLSVWPETFCYTLSIAFAARLYPVAFDIGAVAARIRERNWGEVIPLEATATEINDQLLRLKKQGIPSPPPNVDATEKYDSMWNDYYEMPEAARVISSGRE